MGATTCQAATSTMAPTYQLLYLVGIVVSTADEIWEQDLSNEFKIGFSTEGYHSVDLKCGPESFLLNVTVDTDFEGAIYTRGDFASKKKPCFQTKKDMSAVQGEIAKYSFNIPFTKCHTVEDVSEQQYINILVIQHDRDVIMPGDAAFQLACAFNPEQRLGSTMLTGPRSKISLVEADPGSTVISEQHQVESDTEKVSFPRPPPSPAKDEL